MLLDEMHSRYLEINGENYSEIELLFLYVPYKLFKIDTNTDSLISA